MAGEELRATLRGKTTALGTIRARDIARLIEGLEAALAAAAYATLRSPRRAATGRHTAAVEAASRLHFTDVRPGSVVAVLSLPTLAEETPETLELGVDDLAGAAFDRLVAACYDPDDEVDRGIARALATLAEGLGIGDRHEELLVTSTRSDRDVRLDASVRTRMRRLADSPASRQPDVVIGSLREADFDRRTARLLTATGEAVLVDFSPDLDDQIQDALRSQAHFEGLVTFDAVTSTARRVEVRRISTPEALPFDTSAFWHPASVAELAQAQGVAPAALDGPLIEWTEEERAELARDLADLDL